MTIIIQRLLSLLFPSIVAYCCRANYNYLNPKEGAKSEKEYTGDHTVIH